MKTMMVMVAAMALAACKGGATQNAGGGDKPIVVKAEDLVTEYKANEVAADEKYKGKRVRVGGIISSIDKDAFDNIVVNLTAPGSLLGVMAHVQDSEKSKVAGLAKQQAVVFECKGDGMIMGTPQIGDCTVLVEGKQPGSAPASTPAPKKK